MNDLTPELLAVLGPILPETPEQEAAALAPGAQLAAAIQYAALGWPVLPLEPGGKRPAGRLVPNGLHDASIDPDVIRSWWTAEPWANVAGISGVHWDVVDLDVNADKGIDGRVGFSELCEETGTRPRVLASAATGNGGLHLFVAPTGRGNFAGIRPGVDYRGRGGYVVLAPSRLTPDGRRYRWIGWPSAEMYSLLSDTSEIKNG